MGQIGSARQRLGEDRGLAGLLAACWDAFDLLVTGCWHGDFGERELFAAYAFAGTAAAEGRNLVAGAPSSQAGHGAVTGPAGLVTADRDEAADALAGLAGALHERLVSASRAAAGPGDQAACAAAALQAALVRGLLAAGER